MTKLTLTILGCGDSAGVPRIGGDWGDCDPADPRNRRTRPSIMVQSATTALVVDTGPDFNIQLTRENIRSIDAVLYTHAHSDHVMGLDELRIIQARNKKRVPVYGDAATLTELEMRFNYIFMQTSAYYPPVVEPHILDQQHFGQQMTIGDISFIPFVQEHGPHAKSLGFRFGDIGYSTDMIDLDDKAIAALKGIKTWIADCADFSNGHGTLHSTLPNIQRLNALIGAEQVYLTHLKMFYDYKKMAALLPLGYAPAHDGMKLNYSSSV